MLRHSHRIALLLAGSTLLPAAASAQTIEVSGQVRPRTEYLDPSGAAGGSQTWTSMRTRLGAAYRSEGPVSAFVQVQDVRFFGEETNTLTDFRADNFDLHQGWVQVGTDESLGRLRVGRQEVAFGGERLIGAVGWTQQGRSFDGARMGLGLGGRLDVDFLAFQISESAAAGMSEDEVFWGAYGVLGAGSGRFLDFFALRQHRASGTGDTDQWTAGARYVATDAGFNYRVEGAWQTGERVGADVSAFMAGARVGRDFAGGNAGVTLWFDYLSGTEPGSGDVGAFDTLFGTNHKFYGYADLFLNIPLHTSGRGLVDMAAKGRWRFHPDWTANVDVHRFTVAQDGGLESGDLGTEIDLTLTRALFSGLRISGGAAYVMAGDALAPVRGIDGDVTFGYVMLDLAF